METVLNYLPYLIEPSNVLQILTIAGATGFVLGTEDLGQKKKRIVLLRLFGHAIGLFVGLFLLNVFFMWLSEKLPILFKGTNYSFAVLTGLILYAELCKPYRLGERVTFVFILFSTILVMMEWSSPSRLYSGEQFLVRSTTLVDVCSDLLILLFAIFIRRLSLARYTSAPLHQILTCTEAGLVAGAGICMESMSARDLLVTVRDFQLYLIFVLALMYGINILTYIFSYLMAQNRQALIEMEVLDQKQKAELDLLRLSESSLAELREIRHDIKNHCLYMSNLLREEKYTELEDYFERLTGKFSAQLFGCMDYGNALVTALMNMEQSKADMAGVKLNTTIVVPPALPFEENDLCSLVTNLLDNAIEECERMETEHKTVNVVMNTRESDYFYFCVINPTSLSSTDVLPTLSTRKTVKKGHGYGMDIIRKTVEKYDGHFSYHIEDETFIAEVLMNMNGRR